MRSVARAPTEHTIDPMIHDPATAATAKRKAPRPAAIRERRPSVRLAEKHDAELRDPRSRDVARGRLMTMGMAPLCRSTDEVALRFTGALKRPERRPSG